MSDKLKKQYQNLFDKLHILNGNGDIEGAHILQDKIYRKFIRDIVNGKIGSDVKQYAKNMNKFVVKGDKGRWYA